MTRRITNSLKTLFFSSWLGVFLWLYSRSLSLSLSVFSIRLLSRNQTGTLFFIFLFCWMMVVAVEMEKLSLANGIKKNQIFLKVLIVLFKLGNFGGVSEWVFAFSYPPSRITTITATTLPTYVHFARHSFCHHLSRFSEFPCFTMQPCFLRMLLNKKPDAPLLPFQAHTYIRVIMLSYLRIGTWVYVHVHYTCLETLLSLCRIHKEKFMCNFFSLLCFSRVLC